MIIYDVPGYSELVNSIVVMDRNPGFYAFHRIFKDLTKENK